MEQWLYWRLAIDTNKNNICNKKAIEVVSCLSSHDRHPSAAKSVMHSERDRSLSTGATSAFPARSPDKHSPFHTASWPIGLLTQQHHFRSLNPFPPIRARTSSDCANDAANPSSTSTPPHAVHNGCYDGSPAASCCGCYTASRRQPCCDRACGGGRC